jgi:hypothetical protein
VCCTRAGGRGPYIVLLKCVFCNPLHDLTNWPHTTRSGKPHMRVALGDASPEGAQLKVTQCVTHSLSECPAEEANLWRETAKQY